MTAGDEGADRTPVELTALMQKHVVAAMMRDPRTFAQCRSFLNPDHFTDAVTSDIVAYAFNAWDTYKEIPSRSTLLSTFAEKEAHVKAIKRVYAEMVDLSDTEITIAQITKFARHRAMRNAVRVAAAVLKYEQTGETDDLPRDKKGRTIVPDIASVFKDAAAIGGTLSKGGGFLEDAIGNVINRSLHPQEREQFDTGFPHLNHCGVNIERGEVGCVLAKAKGGKSFLLLNIAYHNALKGKKVVYYNLEIREDRLEDRFAYRVAKMNPGIDKLAAAETDDSITDGKKQAMREECTLSIDEFVAKLKKKVGKLERRIYIQKFVARQTSIDDIRAHLISLRAQHDFVPDVIVLDYVGLLKPTTQYTEMRHTLEQLWLDFRSLCQEFEVGGWGAAQANRGGASEELTSMTSIAECFAIAAHIDVGISVNRKPDEVQKNKGRFYVFASRNGKDGSVVNFDCDFSRAFIQTTGIGEAPGEDDKKDKPRRAKNDAEHIADHAANTVEATIKKSREAVDGRV